MRIALTADPEISVPPFQYGGIERIVDALARGLSGQGHHVTLLSNVDSTCPVRKIPWKGRQSSSRIDTIKNAMQLASITSTNRFDIVHSFSRLAYLLPILPNSIPKLMTYQREISRKTTAIANLLAFQSLEFSAVGRHMIEPVQDIGLWHYIPNFVPLCVYALSSCTTSGSPLIFLGRIEELKGPHIAIEIAKKTNKSLILAGNISDEHQDWFDKCIRPLIDGDQIRYVGPVNDEQKAALLRGAYALLMPILWEEPFGIVMIEAMACGTPVIGFRRGAVPEVVAHEETGYVVDSIEDMIGAVHQIERISRRECRVRVERFYSDIVIINRYISLYEKMIKARKTGFK